jgi:hypothetical protein
MHPSSPQEAPQTASPWRFHLMSCMPLSYFSGVPISSPRIASNYLLSQRSLEWVGETPAACAGSASFRSPAPFFLHRRIFRLSLTLLLDKNKLMLWFRRLRRNSRSKFESSFSKRPSSALGSEEGEPPRFLFVPSPLTEPDFLSDVQVNTPKSGSQSHHSSPTRFARVGICIF